MALTALKSYPNFGTRVAVPPNPIPAVIADGATYNSDLMPSGFGGASAAATSDHAATLELQRYADLAGAVPIGALLSQAMTANVPAWVGSNDGLPFVSFVVSIVNSAGADANITNGQILTGQPI